MAQQIESLTSMCLSFICLMDQEPTNILQDSEEKIPNMDITICANVAGKVMKIVKPDVGTLMKIKTKEEVTCFTKALEEMLPFYTMGEEEAAMLMVLIVKALAINIEDNVALAAKIEDANKYPKEKLCKLIENNNFSMMTPESIEKAIKKVWYSMKINIADFHNLGTIICINSVLGIHDNALNVKRLVFPVSDVSE